MADAIHPVVHIGENSPEEVALKLMHEIARTEDKALYPNDSKTTTRKWILDTYAECLEAVHGIRVIK